jgi:plastocyanin
MRFVSMGLAASAVFALGCSSSSPSAMPGSPTPTPITGGSTAALTISLPRGATLLTTTAFAPNPATVPVGATVTWVNNDVDPHTTTSTTNVWGSPTLQPGASFSFTFQSAGSFTYLCLIHPNMVGTVVVQ